MWRKIHNVPSMRKAWCKALNAGNRWTMYGPSMGEDPDEISKQNAPPYHGEPLTEENLQLIPSTMESDTTARCIEWVRSLQGGNGRTSNPSSPLGDVSKAMASFETSSVLRRSCCSSQSGDVLQTSRDIGAALRSLRQKRLELWVQSAETLLGMRKGTTQPFPLVPVTAPMLRDVTRELWVRLGHHESQLPDIQHHNVVNTAVDGSITMSRYHEVIQPILQEMYPALTSENATNYIEAMWNIVKCDTNPTFEEPQVHFQEFEASVLSLLEPWVRSMEDSVILISQLIFVKCVETMVMRGSPQQQQQQQHHNQPPHPMKRLMMQQQQPTVNHHNSYHQHQQQSQQQQQQSQNTGNRAQSIPNQSTTQQTQQKNFLSINGNGSKLLLPKIK